MYQSTARWWLGTAIALTIVCFVCAFLTGMNGYTLIRTAKVGWKDSSITANIQVFFAFFLIGISQILNGLESQRPDLATKSTTATNEKASETKVPREIIFVFGVCSVITAAMTIALVWLEVAERARRMAHRTAQTMIPNTRRTVVAFEVILVCAMIASCAALMPSIAVVIGIIAILVVLGVYVAGFVKIYSELKSVSSIAAENNKIMYRTVIKEIQKTAAGTVCCAITLLVLCIIISVLSADDWKQSSAPGRIPPIVVAWQILPMTIVLLAINLLHAMRKATARKISSGKTSDFSASDKAGRNTNDKANLAIKTDLDSAPTQNPRSPTTMAQSSLAAYQVDEHT